MGVKFSLLMYFSRYDRLAQEKEELEAEYISFRREVTHTKVGSAAKEIRILKEIIKNLEEDLLKERTKYTRASTRRSQEHRRLIKEVGNLLKRNQLCYVKFNRLFMFISSNDGRMLVLHD